TMRDVLRGAGVRRVRMPFWSLVALGVALTGVFASSSVASPERSAPSGQLRPVWSTAGYDQPISICFGAQVPSKLSAPLRVEHAWRETGQRPVREQSHTVRFTFAPSHGCVTPTYRGRAKHEPSQLFASSYCLAVFPTMRGPGTRVGSFTFTYIYKGKRVSSA